MYSGTSVNCKICEETNARPNWSIDFQIMYLPDGSLFLTSLHIEVVKFCTRLASLVIYYKICVSICFLLLATTAKCFLDYVVLSGSLPMAI